MRKGCSLWHVFKCVTVTFESIQSWRNLKNCFQWSADVLVDCMFKKILRCSSPQCNEGYQSGSIISDISIGSLHHPAPPFFVKYTFFGLAFILLNHVKYYNCLKDSNKLDIGVELNSWEMKLLKNVINQILSAPQKYLLIIWEIFYHHFWQEVSLWPSLCVLSGTLATEIRLKLKIIFLAVFKVYLSIHKSNCIFCFYFLHEGDKSITFGL